MSENTCPGELWVWTVAQEITEFWMDFSPCMTFKMLCSEYIKLQHCEQIFSVWTYECVCLLLSLIQWKSIKSPLAVLIPSCVSVCVCVCVYSCAADVFSGLSLCVSVLGGGVSLRCSGLFFPSHFQHLRSVSSFWLMAFTHPSSPLGTTWPSSAALSVSHASRPGPTEGVWMAQCDAWAVVTFIFQFAHAAGPKSLNPLHLYICFQIQFYFSNLLKHSNVHEFQDIFPPFFFNDSVHSSSTSLCKTWWLMLSQHDMTVLLWSTPHRCQWEESQSFEVCLGLFSCCSMNPPPQRSNRRVEHVCKERRGASAWSGWSQFCAGVQFQRCAYTLPWPNLDSSAHTTFFLVIHCEVHGPPQSLFHLLRGGLETARCCQRRAS